MHYSVLHLRKQGMSFMCLQYLMQRTCKCATLQEVLNFLSVLPFSTDYSLRAL